MAQSTILGNLIAALKVDVSGWQRGLESASKQLKEFGSGAMSLGKNLTQAVSAPIAAAGYAIFNVANDFQDKLGEMGAALGIAEKAANSLGEAFIKMAPQLGVGPAELIEPFQKINKVIPDTTQALSVLRAAGLSAAAGIGDLASNSETLITVMKLGGKEFKTAGEAMSTMIAAARAGRADVKELGEILGKIAPQIKESGVQLKDAAAALAVFTRETGSAAGGGKILKSILEELAGPASKKMADALAKAGTSLAELKKNIAEKGLDKAMQDLGGKLKSVGLTMGDVFSSTAAVSGAMQLADKNTKGLTETFDKVRNASGSLAKAWETSGGADKLATTMSLVQVALIRLGEVVVPLVNKGLDMLNAGLRQAIIWWNGLAAGTKEAIVKFAGLAALLGPLIVVFGAVVTALGWIIGALGTFVGWIAAAGAMLAPFGALLGLIKAGLLLLTGPVGLVVAALVALAIIFRDKLPAALQTAIRWFKDLAKSLQLTKIFASIAKGVSGLWKSFTDFGSKLLKGFPKFFKDAVSGAIKALKSIVDYVSKINFSKMGKSLMGALKSVFQTLGPLIAKAAKMGFDVVMAAAKHLLANLKNGFVLLWESVGEIASAIWDAIKGIFSGESVSGEVTVSMGNVESLLGQILEAIKACCMGGDSGGNGGGGSGGDSGDGSDSGATGLGKSYYSDYVAWVNAINSAMASGTFNSSGEDNQGYYITYNDRGDYQDPGDDCACAPWYEKVLAALSGLRDAMHAKLGEIATGVSQITETAYDLISKVLTQLELVNGKLSAPSITAESLGIEITKGVDRLLASLAPMVDSLQTKLGEIKDKLSEFGTSFETMTADLGQIREVLAPEGDTTIPMGGDPFAGGNVTQEITMMLDSRILAKAVAEHFPDVLTLETGY